jgi:group I intron endonuclease
MNSSLPPKTGLPTTSGIYLITCTANGRIYIGSSTNIRRRWYEHCTTLDNGKSNNSHLQHAWNKYGRASFVIKVLELCERSVLFEREQHYLDTLQPFGEHGFNLARIAARPLSGIVLSPEVRLRIAIANTGRSRSPQMREKLRLANIGRKASPETRAKMSASQKGRKASPETRAKLSASQKGIKVISLAQREKLRLANIGRKASPETRAKMSAALMGHSVSPETRAKIAEKNGGSYIVTSPDSTQMHITNLKGFCRENGLTHSAMIAVANGKQFHHKGWGCAYTSTPEKSFRLRVPRTYSPATRTKIGAAFAKAYIVTSPIGERFTIVNLSEFCRDNDLHRTGMVLVANGKRTHYKGWKCEHALTDPPSSDHNNSQDSSS